MKKRFAKVPGAMLASNAVESAAPASVWGKGCPGKGGKTLNSKITEKDSTKEKESE